MGDISRSGSWTEELISLVDNGIQYNNACSDVIFDHHSISNQPHFSFESSHLPPQGEQVVVEEEDLRDQVKGFFKAWGELLFDLSKGCKDVAVQCLFDHDSYLVNKFGPCVSEVSSKFRFLNEYLPEDRDPLLAWPVVFFVFVLALSVLSVNNAHSTPAPLEKKLTLHPPSARKVLLPDGRHLAYHEQGIVADRARFTLISPHAFLSSRLAGIPGVKASILEDFGVRLVTYDLPGFGESDPHASRDLNTSALDMLHLANAVGVDGKFWVLGYSSAAMHAWATLKYIPNKVAGAAFVAPMVNPYEARMTKEEISKTWERWEQRRKFMFTLASRFPSLLSSFYRKSFFSGKHGQIQKWFSLTLGEKDKAMVEKASFEEFWQRDVEESVRQGNMKPFIQEARLQVSDWGFSLADLHLRRTCPDKGILSWLMSIYSHAECELTGFAGPIHIWQGLDDHVVPPAMAQYINRIIPSATLHELPNEGHFSFYFFCDECHREILSTLFGDPLGPLDNMNNTDQSSLLNTDGVDFATDAIQA